MKRFIAIVGILSQLVASPAYAGGCFVRPKFFKQRVIREKVFVQQQPIINQQLFYPVGTPAGLGYQALQQAELGQIQRQFQRLQDRMASLASYQQQATQFQQYQAYQQQQIYQPQYQQPYAQPYAAPQYVAPQQPCPSCAGQASCPGPAAQHALSRHEPLPPPAQGQHPTLNQHCAQCHQGGSAKGGFNVDDLKGMPLEDRAYAFEKAISGEMPKDAQPLTDEQTTALGNELFSPAEIAQLRQMMQQQGNPAQQ